MAPVGDIMQQATHWLSVLHTAAIQEVNFEPGISIKGIMASLQRRNQMRQTKTLDTMLSFMILAALPDRASRMTRKLRPSSSQTHQDLTDTIAQQDPQSDGCISAEKNSRLYCKTQSFRVAEE